MGASLKELMFLSSPNINSAGLPLKCVLPKSRGPARLGIFSTRHLAFGAEAGPLILEMTRL